MVAAPSGTVTFLFTDIQSSTRLWQDHAEAMQTAYARHDTILREAISQHGGAVYKVIGDAIQAAFPTAPAAVVAALQAQLALTDEDWTALGLPEPLRVRMALHVGAVDPDPDGDYRSPVLNRLGRLLGAGHGGQVLLSEAARSLVRGQLPDESELLDLGAQRLKDLLEPEHIWQLLHPRLPRDFPPLATLDRKAHNLPLQPTPLIGREPEIAEVLGLLRREETRLLTLTGPGGTGKTRLALQVASELVEDYPDGVWFVNLAPLIDPDLVPSAIATALGVRERGGDSILSLLQHDLANKRLLLVLDNLEHLLAAAPLVGELLAAAPRLTVLTTSRAPLRLRAEREYPVPALGLPRRKPPPTLEQMTQFEAVRLFVDRAMAVTPNFAVTNETAPAVAEICHRLDGLPLAIELAAARIRMLSPPAMLARLEHRLPLLTGGARDQPARQQTLRNAIAWSYDLLEPDEQLLYRRLSVFAGGWTLEAAEAVASSPRSGELALDVLAGLEQLVEHSLVRLEEGAEGTPRFMMLETIREYGLEQLDARESAETQQRHAEFHLRLAERAKSGLHGAETAVWLSRLESEIDNLRGALAWTMTFDPDRALELGSNLERFWWLRGHLVEGLQWLTQALAAATVGVSASRATALRVAAILALDLGDLDGAAALATDALTMAEDIQLHHEVWGARQTLGEIATIDGRFAEGLKMFEENVALARELDDPNKLQGALANASTAAAYTGDRVYAKERAEEALGLARATGDPWSTSVLLGNLAWFSIDDGDIDRALELFAECIQVIQELHSPYALVTALEGVAAVAALRNQPDVSARLQSAAATLRESIAFAVRPIDLDEHERYLTLTRSQMTDDSWQALWDAGKSMSLDDATGEALSYISEFGTSVS